MKVKDLIGASVWVPNRRSDSVGTPAVSILLPTDGRGTNAGFRRCVESLLTQRLTDFELIIVDDASVDGTADAIAEFMERDARVHLIRHPRHVGLPAISEFEAYSKSRGEYIAFASDDVVFEPDGLSALLDHARANDSSFVHGYSHVRLPEERDIGRRDELGRYTNIVQRALTETPSILSTDVWKLKSYNFIPNSAMLVRRDVLETIGLRDPHLLLVHLRDWDLSRRILERYRMDYVDVRVSNDSGVSAVTVNEQRSCDFADFPRDEQLTPSAFPERELTHVPAGADERLTAFSNETLTSLQSGGQLHHLPSAEPGRKSILVLLNEGPSLQILTHGMPDELRPHFNFYYGRLDRASLLPAVANSSAVLVNRSLDILIRSGLARDIECMGVPLFWFLDDNFFTLSRSEPFLQFYEPKSFREVCPKLDLAVCPTPAMADCLREYAGIEESVLWPPVAHPHLAAGATLNPPADELRVAVPGGLFRHGGTFDRLATARRQIGVPMRVFTRAGGQPIAEEGLSAEIIPFQMSWAQFVLQWRGARSHVMYHPAGDSSEVIRSHLAYKNNNAIMVAWLTGAVPLLADEPAYQGVGEAEGVLKLTGNSADELAGALGRLTDPDFRAECFRRLTTFCRKEFNPQRVLPAVRRIVEKAKPLNAHVIDEHWCCILRRLEPRIAPEEVNPQPDPLAWAIERNRLEHDVQSLWGTVRHLEARCQQLAIDRHGESNSLRHLLTRLLRRSARIVTAPLRRLLAAIRR